MRNDSEVMKASNDLQEDPLYSIKIEISIYIKIENQQRILIWNKDNITLCRKCLCCGKGTLQFSAGWAPWFFTLVGEQSSGKFML